MRCRAALVGGEGARLPHVLHQRGEAVQLEGLVRKPEAVPICRGMPRGVVVFARFVRCAKPGLPSMQPRAARRTLRAGQHAAGATPWGLQLTDNGGVAAYLVPQVGRQPLLKLVLEALLGANKGQGWQMRRPHWTGTCRLALPRAKLFASAYCTGCCAQVCAAAPAPSPAPCPAPAPCLPAPPTTAAP